MKYYTGWPYDCHICGHGSLHQICTPCTELFQRGLKPVTNISNTYKNLDIHSIRFELGKYLTREHELPLSITMNEATHHDYCVRNKNLPSTPPHEKGDAMRHIHGIPIDIVSTVTYGYTFSDVSLRLPNRIHPQNSPRRIYK